MSRQILAIEIRNHAISAVLLSTGLKSNVVMDCALLPFKAQSEDGDGLTQALALLMEKMHPAAANVVISLPSDKALFRFLTVPFREDNKIRQILPFELEPILPVNVDGLKIDFQKYALGDSTEVLAVAMERSVFQGYMHKLGAAGIRPHLVVPGGFPLIGQIVALDEQQGAATLVLDVDADSTTLFALRSGRVEMVRCLPSSLANETSTEALALRVRQTLTAWSDSVHEEVVPSLVYASGPGLSNADQVEKLAQALEMPIQGIDLCQWLPRVEVTDSVAWTPHLMNDALALAVLEAEGRNCPNFHRVRSHLRNYWSAYRPFITGPAILLAVVLLIATGSVWLQNYYLKKQVGRLDARLEQIFKETFPNTRLMAAPLDQMKSELKELKKGGSGSEQNSAQVSSIEVLLQISQSIPENMDVVLSQMTIGADDITVAGETTDFNNVDDIKSRLEKNGMFKMITIASANMDKSGNKVLFKLKIEL